MPKQKKPAVGTVAWRDLTVKHAERVRDFYAKVVGWKVEPIDMGGYSDYCMLPPAGKTPEAGICHKRGSNAKLPSRWLMYIVVADLDASLRAVKRLGGKALSDVLAQGNGRMAVIRDPAGAVCALYQEGT
jgi:predicted enzyme related to lactoylglutathione lyase